MERTLLQKRMLLAGEWVIGTNLIDVENPQDGEIIAQVPAATKEEVLLLFKKGYRVQRLQVVYQPLKEWAF